MYDEQTEVIVLLLVFSIQASRSCGVLCIHKVFFCLHGKMGLVGKINQKVGFVSS